MFPFSNGKWCLMINGFCCCFALWELLFLVSFVLQDMFFFTVSICWNDSVNNFYYQFFVCVAWEQIMNTDQCFPVLPITAPVFISSALNCTVDMHLQSKGCISLSIIRKLTFFSTDQCLIQTSLLSRMIIIYYGSNQGHLWIMHIETEL